MSALSLNHIAILVESIEKFIEQNPSLHSEMGKIEEFCNEGTRELYIGSDGKSARLLIIQAIGNGPYQRAIEKRGYGPHHIAIDVKNIMDFMDAVNGSGWNLHPCSLRTYQDLKQIWLCKTGNLLIEVQERQKLDNRLAFIDQVSVPFSSPSLCEALQIATVKLGAKFQIFSKGKEINPPTVRKS